MMSQSTMGVGDGVVIVFALSVACVAHFTATQQQQSSVCVNKSQNLK